MKKFKEIISSRLFVCVAIFLCAIASFVMVTYFTGMLRVEENFGCYYDALGSSLLQGRLDVPEKYIGGEAFISNGKFYGYFGSFPAVIRIVLNTIFPNMFCKWSRIVVYVFYLLSVLLVFKIYEELKKKDGKPNLFADGVYLILLGLGSSLYFLTSKSYIYHESIIIASFCSLASYYFFISFINSKRDIRFIWSLVFAFLAIHTRVNVGLGNMVCLGIYGLISSMYLFHLPNGLLQKLKFIFPKEYITTHLKKNLFALLILFFVTAVTIGGINYIKFGNVLTFAPLDKHLDFINNPARMAKMEKYDKGFLLNISNLIHNTQYYFGVGGLRVLPKFPFITAEAYRSFIPQINSIDNVEFNVSLLFSNPIIFISSIIGFVVIFIKKKHVVLRLAVLGSLVTMILTLSSIGVSERYFHDFFPLIVITSSIGFFYVYDRLSKNILFKVILFLLITYSLYVNFAITFLNQRKDFIYQTTGNIERNMTRIDVKAQSGLGDAVYTINSISRIVVVQKSPGNTMSMIVKPKNAKYFTVYPAISPDIFDKLTGNKIAFFARIYINDQIFQEKSMVISPTNQELDNNWNTFTFGPFPNSSKSYDVKLLLITDSQVQVDDSGTGWGGFYWNNNLDWFNTWVNRMFDHLEK